MKNITPHLKKHFVFVCEGMLSYYDGKQTRKNRRFVKALWQILRYETLPSVDNSISIDNVLEHMGTAVTKNTKKMIKSNIKRGGWQWLEGANGDLFGERFVDEYVRRCEILEKEELIEIIGRDIDRINHHNFPESYPTE